MACSNCGHTSDGDLVARSPDGFGFEAVVVGLFRVTGREPPPIELCRPCIEFLSQKYEAETHDAEWGTAVIFGVLAAVLASLVWYAAKAGTSYEVGFTAVGVGWLVGQAVRFGAGRRRGPLLQYLSLTIASAATMACAYLIEHHRVATDLARTGLPGLPLILHVSTSLGMLVVGLTTDPLALIFGAVGLYVAFQIPAPRRIAIVARPEERAAVRGEAP